MKRQLLRRPIMKFLCLFAMSCAVVVLAGLRWGTRAHAAEVGTTAANALLSLASTTTPAAGAHMLAQERPMPCYQYVIPPDDCTDGSGNNTGGDGDPNDTDGSQGTVWPSEFGVIGSYNGHIVVGWATREGTSSAYTFWGEGLDGCEVIGVIDLSIAEAVMIDMNISTNLSSWSVTGADNCD